MKESDIEKRFCQSIKDKKGIPYKFISPNRRNVPDRLCLYPIPSKHRLIVAQYVRFAEIKKPGEAPRAGQLREIDRLRNMGFLVEVIDNA